MNKYDWQKRQYRYFEEKAKNENGFLFAVGLVAMSVLYILCYVLACFW